MQKSMMILTDTKVITSPPTGTAARSATMTAVDELVAVAALRAVLDDMQALNTRLLTLATHMERSALVTKRGELHPPLDVTATPSAFRVEWQAVMRDRQALIARIEALPPLARRALITTLTEHGHWPFPTAHLTPRAARLLLIN